MPVLQAILDRRSIREFVPGASVSEDQVFNMLEAAMMAPSAHNSRPWEYVVVRDQARLEALRKAHPYARMLESASLAVVICMSAGMDDAMSVGLVQQGCAASAQNLMLQATAEGLGSCWCGLYPREALVSAVRGVLDIPAELTPFCLIAIGVAAEEPERRGQYDGSKVYQR